MINTTFGFETPDFRDKVFWQEAVGITDNPIAIPTLFFKNSRRFIFSLVSLITGNL